MQNTNKIKDSTDLTALIEQIEDVISDVQSVRLKHDLDKLTHVRLVDLQYSAKLVLDMLKNNDIPEQTGQVREA